MTSRMRPGVIQIWHWTVRQLSEAADLLSEEEAERVEGMVAHRRAEYVAARAGVKRVLAELLAVEAATIDLRISPNGKPQLKGAELHFNLSHSGGQVALAVGTVELGIDVEAAWSHVVSAGLAAHVMTDLERATFANVDAHLRQEAFLRLWTRKEAVLKATGDGLRVNPRELHVGFGSAAARPISRNAKATLRRPVSVVDIQCGPGVIGAVAAVGAVPHIETHWLIQYDREAIKRGSCENQPLSSSPAACESKQSAMVAGVRKR